MPRLGETAGWRIRINSCGGQAGITDSALMQLERSTDTWDLRWHSRPMCSSATFMYLYPGCTLITAVDMLNMFPFLNSTPEQSYWNASPGWSSRIPVWGFPKIINHDHFISWYGIWTHGCFILMQTWDALKSCCSFYQISAEFENKKTNKLFNAIAFFKFVVCNILSCEFMLLKWINTLLTEICK